MPHRPRSLFGLALAAAALCVTIPLACADSSAGEGDLATGSGESEGAGPGSGAGAGGPAPACEGPLGPPQDPSGLVECCPDVGGAHCLDDVPADFVEHVAACDGGGYCVPDPFIETGGVFTPKACSAFDGSEGVCLSACIPKVSAVVSILEQDVCEANERCAPCVFGGDATGACDIKFSCEDDGSSGAGGGGAQGCDDPATCENECPPIDPSIFPSCGTCGGGHCVPNAQVPDPELLADLAPCDADNVCVPAELIATGGKFTPPTCDSVGGLEGRCLSLCLPQVAEMADQLPQGICTADQKCVPCFDPLSGEDTGACSLSCDIGPSGGPTTFEKCCPDGGGGTCLPASNVPPDQQSKLGEDSCAQDGGAMLCVPNVFVDAQQSGVPYQGMACETSFWMQLLFGAEFAQGACMPKCVPEVDDAPLTEQGDCADGFKCVPCNDPTSGQSTGACEPQG